MFPMFSNLKESLRAVVWNVSNFGQPRLKVSNKYNYTVLGDGASRVPDSGHYFVGYYDVDPLNMGNVLCHRISSNFSHEIMPDFGDIGLISLKSGQFEALTETRALNWQLGSRAQWIDSNHFIFNDVVSNFHRSKIFNIETREVVAEFPRAFWAISTNKNIGASLNFFRIRCKRPGYGYNGQSVDGQKEQLTLFSLSTGAEIYSINLEEVFQKIGFKEPVNDAYLNHVAWSPCSEKLLTLFHFAESEGRARKVFPLLFNITTGDWDIIDTTGFFSHHTWLNSTQILAFKESNNKHCYCIWSFEHGWQEVAGSMPYSDGHPSPLVSTDKIIVDTYPNRLGKMRLFIGSSTKGRSLESIGHIISPTNNRGAIRCDLHPRACSGNSAFVCDLPTLYGRRILYIERNNVK